MCVHFRGSQRYYFLCMQAVAPLQVTLIPKSCPVGFHLIEKEKGVQITEKESNKSFYYCDCNENNNENILKCEGETIILKVIS